MRVGSGWRSGADGVTVRSGSGAGGMHERPLHLVARASEGGVGRASCSAGPLTAAVGRISKLSRWSYAK
jgi:hypothetical protein